MAKKDIIETDECLAFRAELNEAELREYQHARAQLAQDGFLVSMKTKITPEQRATKERLLKRTKDEMDALWSDPDFCAEHATWQEEYRAAAEMCAARERAGITQETLARRLHIPRANVSRMENGQNVTFATFTKYLHGCGFDFSITIFPMKTGGKKSVPVHRRDVALA